MSRQADHDRGIFALISLPNSRKNNQSTSRRATEYSADLIGDLPINFLTLLVAMPIDTFTLKLFRRQPNPPMEAKSSRQYRVRYG